MPPQAMAVEQSGGRRQRRVSAMTALDQGDTPAEVDEPGPGHYFGPDSAGYTSLGKHPLSQCASAPELSLPKTGFENWRKVKISKAHVADIVGIDAPGPCYLTTEQSMSTLGKRTTKVGTSLRPDLSRSLGVDPNGSPGPLAYNPPGPFETRIRNMSSQGAKGTGFGTAPRFQDIASRAKPPVGPGQYTPKACALSKSTGRSFSVGWEAYAKVRQPHIAGQQGAESSGPGPPLWQDPAKGSHAHEIPRERRFRGVGEKNGVPGPKYDREERAVSSLKSCCSDTRNPAGCRFGKPARKPRFRQHSVVLKVRESNGCWGYF